MKDTAATPRVAELTGRRARSRQPANDASGQGSVRGSTADDLHARVLSRELFLKHLQIEKRRSDRTDSPLALIVAVIGEHAAGIETVNAVIDLFAASKRETDLLGFLDERRIGLLLPHTAVAGAQAYLHSIHAQTAELPIEIQAGEYPNELFEHVLSEAAVMSEPLEYIAEPSKKHSGLAMAAKRTLDVAGAAAGVVILSPIMLVTALAVAVSSRGPVIFRQSRLGRGGKPFVLFKFRSMRTDSDDTAHREYVANLIDGKHDEINQGDADKPLYKMTVDPRVTSVGRFIRRTSLDELPQLFNVLRGEMSLVGPRPPLPYEAERYRAWHLRRILEVQPGVTGLWQVEGRSTTSFDDMVRLDLRYAQTRSFWLDLRIILRTVFVLFGSHGAT